MSQKPNYSLVIKKPIMNEVRELFLGFDNEKEMIEYQSMLRKAFPLTEVKKVG